MSRPCTAQFQVLNQVEQHIHRAALTRRSVLIDDRVNRDGSIDARHLIAHLVHGKGLHNGDDAMLTIREAWRRHQEHTEDLAGVKMVNAQPSWLFVLTGRSTEAQEVEAGMGNVARDKTSQSDGT